MSGPEVLCVLLLPPLESLRFFEAAARQGESTPDLSRASGFRSRQSKQAASVWNQAWSSPMDLG